MIFSTPKFRNFPQFYFFLFQISFFFFSGRHLVELVHIQGGQAGNQIGALSAEQLIQMEALMAAHYRAIAFDRARELEEAERGRARLKSFLGD